MVSRSASRASGADLRVSGRRAVTPEGERSKDVPEPAFHQPRYRERSHRAKQWDASARETDYEGAAPAGPLLSGPRKALLARLLVLPQRLAVSLVTIRLVVSGTGVDGFAVFALIASLPALLPVTDLGVGASITDAVARREHLGEAYLRRTLRTSFRVLTGMGTSIVALTFVLFGVGAWPNLLGTGDYPGVDLAALAGFATFGLGPRCKSGNRLLLGAGLQHLVIIIQAVGGSLYSCWYCRCRARRCSPLGIYGYTLSGFNCRERRMPVRR